MQEQNRNLNNLNKTDSLVATQSFEDFVRKANYYDAQHQILDELKAYLAIQKIKRMFCIVFCIFLGVLVFFINIDIAYPVNYIFKALLGLGIVFIIDYFYYAKIDVGRLQSNLLLITISTNLLYVNSELSKLIKSRKDEKDELEGNDSCCL